MLGFLAEGLPAGSKISELHVQNFRTRGRKFQNKMALDLGRDFQNEENRDLSLVMEERFGID